MKTFGIAGWSGSGKTTLLLRLIPSLVARGVTVATIKHTHHDVTVGDAGMRAQAVAGAVETVVAGAGGFAIVHEHHGASEPALAALAGRVCADLLLVEGFKSAGHPKLEVWDPALGEPLLAATEASVVAVASDAPVGPIGRPVFRRDDVDGIAALILTVTGLGHALR